MLRANRTRGEGHATMVKPRLHGCGGVMDRMLDMRGEEAGRDAKAMSLHGSGRASETSGLVAPLEQEMPAAKKSIMRLHADKRARGATVVLHCTHRAIRDNKRGGCGLSPGRLFARLAKACTEGEERKLVLVRAEFFHPAKRESESDWVLLRAHERLARLPNVRGRCSAP